VLTYYATLANSSNMAGQDSRSVILAAAFASLCCLQHCWVWSCGSKQQSNAQAAAAAAVATPVIQLVLSVLLVHPPG
jgi:hypothetical protein